VSLRLILNISGELKDIVGVLPKLVVGEVHRKVGNIILGLVYSMIS